MVYIFKGKNTFTFQKTKKTSVRQPKESSKIKAKIDVIKGVK
jgi:hypothetical protein